MRLDEVCRELGLSRELEQALVLREGVLGRLLRLCEDADAGQSEAVMRALVELPGVSGSEFIRMQMNAAVWADSATG
jgi:c-di-GMP-related signal transduction protein